MTTHPTSPFHVEIRGGGDPPVVLVHGFGAHGGFWRRWLPRLEARHTVHVVDLKGFGQAPAPPGSDYSPLAQARHLVELLRGFGRIPPIVIGHSLGAGIVVAATLRLMDEGGARLPGGLVLVSGAVYPQKLPPFLSLAQLPGIGDLFLLAPPPRFALRMGIRTIVHDRDTVNAEQVEMYREPLRSFRRRRAILRAARQIGVENGGKVAQRIGELDLPVLLLWGEEDPVVPLRLGRQLEAELPDARLVILPGVGHLPPEEAPDASLDPVLAFLDERSGQRRWRKVE
jgi:pimeloyl-ACP methyl ester carboxylesterase